MDSQMITGTLVVVGIWLVLEAPLQIRRITHPRTLSAADRAVNALVFALVGAWLLLLATGVVA